MSAPRKKSITFSADPNPIARARNRANELNTTLNEAFRDWLEQFTRPSGGGAEYRTLMKQLRDVQPGRKFTREEINER